MSTDTMRRMVSPLPQKPGHRSSSSSVGVRDRVGGGQPSASHPSDRIGSLKGTHQQPRSSSTPPAASSSSVKKKKRTSKPSEMEIARRKVKLLSSFRALSPTLPPSPPPSRSPSPRPPSENRADTPSAARPTHDSTTTRSSSSTTTKRSIPSPPSENDDPESRKRSRLDEEAAKQRAEAQRIAKETEIKQQAIAERRRKRASEVWDTDRFKKLGRVYKERARTIKHAADGRSRAHPASSSAPPTVWSLMSVVELTDSILLFVYAFWCEDQTTPGRVGVDMWRSLDGMKKVVRTLWEGVIKASGGGPEEESAKALLGLCYLIDALVLMHTTVYEQSVLHARTQRISSSPRPPPPPHLAGSSSRANGSQSSNGNHGMPPADSPASLASSSSSPSSLPSLSVDPGLPPDYIPSILSLTTSLPRSLRLLSTSQQLLSFPVLRRNFPSTWTISMNSDIAGCGGDGGERMVDPEWVEGGWGWPLGPSGAMGVGAGGSGVGAGGMLPHLVVFGRALLAEWVKGRKEVPDEYDLAKGWRRPA